MLAPRPTECFRYGEAAPRRKRPHKGVATMGRGRVATTMPKLTLTYQLPDEQAEYDAARLGRSALNTLWEIDQHCRSIIKYSQPSEETERFAEQIRAMIPGECLEL